MTYEGKVSCKHGRLSRFYSRSNYSKMLHSRCISLLFHIWKLSSVLDMLSNIYAIVNFKNKCYIFAKYGLDKNAFHILNIS